MDGQDNTRIIDRKYPSYWLKGAAEDQWKDWQDFTQLSSVRLKGFKNTVVF